jgi:hypothetical protein
VRGLVERVGVHVGDGEDRLEIGHLGDRDGGLDVQRVLELTEARAGELAAIQVVRDLVLRGLLEHPVHDGDGGRQEAQADEGHPREELAMDGAKPHQYFS